MNIQELDSIGNEKTNLVQGFVQGLFESLKIKELVAKKLNISPSTTYDFRNGAWEKIGIERFNQVLNIATSDTSTWQPVETKNFTVIRQAINMQADMKRMSAIIAETGSGKTFAAKKCAKMLGAAYMMVDATMTQAAFLDEILKALNVHNYMCYRGISDKTKKVVAALMLHPVPVIIIDDAGKMKDNVLQLIQVLYDRTVGKAGILLMGTPTLKNKIESYANRDKCYCRELIGRIADWKLLAYPMPNETAKICQANDITDESAITWLVNATVSLHTLTDMIVKAKKYSEKKGKMIDSDMLSQLNKDLTWQQTSY
jgi:DNA transposition AAA+ family ATPase